MLTFGQLKTDIRSRVFPSGEADNLVADHDKAFIDALIDLQTYVPCQQQDNTDIFPQCSTTYNCGLTVLPVPRGIIKKVSVVDKIDPVTGRENPDVEDDWCSEIVYSEVDYCHVRRYLDLSRHQGCCLPVGLFFGLGFCNHRPYPTPTEPAGLPSLPLGYHYPQASTDRTRGRAGGGVWAKDRTNILIAPWIQSTESVVVKWDGLKRSWGDADLVDDDPLFIQCVETYLRCDHGYKWDKDQEMPANMNPVYMTVRAMLIHQCREETRARACEPSFARGSNVSSGASSLHYNDKDQSWTETCPDGVTSASKTVKAGTVSSPTSVADANARAHAQAVTQAQAALVCPPVSVQATNDTPGNYTAHCTGDSDAPPPAGNNPTATVPVGTVTGSGADHAAAVSDANAKAQLQAENTAKSQLQCTWYNAPRSYTFTCPDGTQPGNVSVPVPAGDPTCTSNASQADANQRAYNRSVSLTNARAVSLGIQCGGQPVYNVGNTEMSVPVFFACPQTENARNGVTVVVHVPANTFYRGDLAAANLRASDQATNWGTAIASGYCSRGQYGNFPVEYGGSL